MGYSKNIKVTIQYPKPFPHGDNTPAFFVNLINQTVNVEIINAYYDNTFQTNESNGRIKLLCDYANAEKLSSAEIRAELLIKGLTVIDSSELNSIATVRIWKPAQQIKSTIELAEI